MAFLRYSLYLLSARVQLIASIGLAVGGFVGALRLFALVKLGLSSEASIFAGILTAILLVLLFKAFSLFLLIASDLILLNSPKQELGIPMEKVNARITRFLAEHNLEGIYLDKYSLGAEKSVLAWLERAFRLNPPVMLFVWRPFIVIRYRKTSKGTFLWMYTEDSTLAKSAAKTLETSIKYF